MKKTFCRKFGVCGVVGAVEAVVLCDLLIEDIEESLKF